MYKLLILLLLTSCAPIIRVGGGCNVSSELVDTYKVSRTGESVEVATLELQILEPIHIVDHLYADFGGGLSLFDVVSEKSVGVSLDTTLRLRYSFEFIDPYLIAQHGFGCWEPRLEDQGSNWGFPTYFGAGIRIPTGDRIWFSVEYRVFHESNGADTFLKSPTPNPGYNTDMLFFGLELQF